MEISGKVFSTFLQFLFHVVENKRIENSRKDILNRLGINFIIGICQYEALILYGLSVAALPMNSNSLCKTFSTNTSITS